MIIYYFFFLGPRVIGPNGFVLYSIPYMPCFIPFTFVRRLTLGFLSFDNPFLLTDGPTFFFLGFIPTLLKKYNDDQQMAPPDAEEKRNIYRSVARFSMVSWIILGVLAFAM